LPTDWTKPVYIADFEHLNLAAGNSEQNQGQNKTQTTLSAAYLSKLPGLSISVKQLKLGSNNIGKVQLDSRPVLGGIDIHTLDIQSSDITAQLQGRVIARGQVDAINLKGQLNGVNWGNALTSFGYSGFMQNGSGPISFQLSWLGTLTQPQLPTMEGKISFDLKNGSLSKLNPGVIKLLGLFSLDSLLQHLSLNFSDVINKGLAFDTMTGDYVIENSIASTNDFRLTGPSLNLLLLGSVNLAQQTLDQTVTVMPQVGGSLAVAATLIGGPLAGAATWVADKVISSTLLKDRGIVYRVTGTWDKPIVTSAS
jgi:uncharacterized protein YhdP